MRERKRSCCQLMVPGRQRTHLAVCRTQDQRQYVHRQIALNLPCRVPELQAYCPVLEVHGLGEEVDACCQRWDVRARAPMVAWYVLSKVSYICGQSGRPGKLTKRVMRLVLPTLCSPRKTSLNFLSGDEAGNSLPPAFVGVAGADMVLVGRGEGERCVQVEKSCASEGELETARWQRGHVRRPRP